MTEVKEKISGSEEVVCLFTAETSDGRPFHCYIKLTLDKLNQFGEDKLAGRKIDLTKLGEIVGKGWGMLPTKEVHDEMVKKFGDVKKA